MKRLIIGIAIASAVLVGCDSNNDEPVKKSTETATVTQPPVTHTETPTDTSTVTTDPAPGTETSTEVVQPTDTVTAPPSTVTETHTP